MLTEADYCTHKWVISPEGVIADCPMCKKPYPTSLHPLYSTWRGLWERCTNPKHKSYPAYGGRGVTVCDRWKDFFLFVEDMGLKPSPEHSIDRLLNDGNYEPKNCWWVTADLQQVNRRQRRTKREILLANIDNIVGVLPTIVPEQQTKNQ